MQRNDWMDRIERGDVPHAILFAGTKESGGLSLARRAAARYLKHSDDTDGLLNNPFYLEPSDYQVKTVRDALQAINAQTYERGRHCIVFPDAHTMSEAVQDVLLKTLEEPPADTLLLLTGIESGFRPTILSRCMILRTETEPWETIRDRLVQNGADPQNAALAAKLCDGVYGRAEAFLAEDALAFRREAIAVIRRFAAKSKPYAALSTLCTDTVAEEGDDGSVKKTKKVSAERLDTFFDIFLSLLADVLRLKNGVSDVRNQDSAETETIFNSSFTTAQIQGMINITVEAKEMLAYKASAAMTVDWILARLP